MITDYLENDDRCKLSAKCIIQFITCKGEVHYAIMIPYAILFWWTCCFDDECIAITYGASEFPDHVGSSLGMSYGSVIC